MNPNLHSASPFTAVLVRPIQSSPLAAATALPVCAATGRLPLSLLRRYFPAATGLVFEGSLGLTAVPSKTSSSLEEQLIFLLPEPSFDYLVISDPTSLEIVGNQKEQNNNMLVGRKTMDSSKMQDPNLVTDRTREEILALKEEIAVLRKEFNQLQMIRVRDDMKMAEVREGLDSVIGLKSEVKTLAGKVKEFEKYFEGGVKLGVVGLEKFDTDEVKKSLEANTGCSRSKKEKEGPDCEVMEENAMRNTAPTGTLEGSKKVEAKSEVNNNMEDEIAKSSTASKTQDTKEVKKTGVGASGETFVLIEKNVEKVKAERSTASTRPVKGTKEVEKTGVVASKENSELTTGPVVLDFVTVKPKMVKKKLK